MTKNKMVACIALKKDKMAVLVYSNGNFLAILACTMNQDDQVRLPPNRNKEPTAQSLFVP